MAKIGVIVPVYNVEAYLRKCVDSILAQTFPDFELILVDDGSSDTSGAICDEYAERDRRVRAVHTENRGVAAARNRGLEENRSEYITFVDPDDWAAREYLETLYRLAEAHQADLLAGCIRNISEGERIQADGSWKWAAAEPVSRAEIYRRMFLCEGNTSVSPCAKLYHRSVLGSVRYPAGEIHEDSAVIDRIVENSKNIVYTSYAGYYYFRQRGSILHGRMSPEHTARVRNAKRLWEFAGTRYPQIEDAARIFYLRNCLELLTLMSTDPAYRPEAKKLRSEVLSESRFFVTCRYCTVKDRLAAAALLLGLSWYKLAWRIYLRASGKLSGTVVS